ncbi:MAG: hypothetical protein K1Y36_02410 [Blastocatellia bacterium]|nr:hypothetical protein [Blastocatellia bacterium]
MELAEVEPFLQKLGLVAQINPAAYRKQIRVLGEINYDESLGLEVGGWICYGWQEEGCWVVETPPILIPGPGPLYQVQSLEETVHLIAYVFEHRQEIRTAENLESYDLACQLNERFRQQWQVTG